MRTSLDDPRDDERDDLPPDDREREESDRYEQFGYIDSGDYDRG